MSEGNLLKENILDQLTIGVVKVDKNQNILGYNRTFAKWFSRDADEKDFLNQNFYQVLGYPFFFEGVFAPFHFAREKQQTTRTIVGEVSSASEQNLYFEPRISSCNRLFELSVTPISSDSVFFYRVEITDVSESSKLNQRLEMLKTAGAELAEIVDRMTLTENERKKQLKEIITMHMRQILNYDVVEIRVLDPDPQKGLVPFLSFGLNEDARQRKLFPQSNDNGITGYVADSGEPYICDDANNDAHYLPGAIDARSSLTVPLIFCNKLIGVCNVESSKPHAFSKMDETFLQLYAKDLAMALHFHDSFSNKIREIEKNYRNGIKQSIKPSIDCIFDSTLSALSNANENKPTASDIQSILNISSELKDSLPKLIHELSEPCEDDGMSKQSFPHAWEKAIKKYPQSIDFLKEKRILFVCSSAPDHPDPSSTVNQLETLGSKVDVVHSTKSALQALLSFQYNVVISDLNPDGYFFDNRNEEFSNGKNANGCSLYDIHLEGYCLPIENNESDRLVRERVYQEIYVEQKLDAFFLSQKINALQLSPLPIFILRGKPGYHDPTHIQRDLGNLGNRCQPMFITDDQTPAMLLKSITDSLMNK